MLFSRPGTYHTYIAGSPSIWWKDRQLMKRWPELEERLRRGAMEASVLIGIGAGEKPSMIEDAERLHELMLPYDGAGLRLRFRKFEDEGHVSVLHPLISEMLRFIGRKETTV